MNLRTFRIGGVHPEENKITAEMATQVAPLPKQAIFPLGQHIGAPAKPVVAKGDKVKVGTLIAEAGGFVSAPIYSSVSGTVFKVDTSIDATGYRKPCIIINVEGDEWEESIDRSEKLETLESHSELTPEEIVNRIKVLVGVFQAPVVLAAEAAEVVKRIGAILVVLTLVAEAAEVVALPTEMKCMAALAAQELF